MDSEAYNANSIELNLMPLFRPGPFYLGEIFTFFRNVSVSISILTSVLPFVELTSFAFRPLKHRRESQVCANEPSVWARTSATLHACVRM